MSDSVRSHRQQPTRLPRPWDSPGKNTGVGCHFLLQCMKVKSESEVAQSLNVFKNISLHFCWLDQVPKQGPYIILVVVLFNVLFISEQSLWNTTHPHFFPMLLTCWRNQVRNQTCGYDPHLGFVCFSNSSYNLVLNPLYFLQLEVMRPALTVIRLHSFLSRRSQTFTMHARARKR